MVLQSEIATSILDSLNTKTYTVEFGYSSTNNYNDDSLDSVIVSAKTIDRITIVDNIMTFKFNLELSEGVGSTINSYLIRDEDGLAIKKDLFTAFLKTATDLKEFTARIGITATV